MRTALILWCALMAVSIVTVIGAALCWITAPDYFWSAAVQMSLVGAFGVLSYARLGMAAFRRTERLPRLVYLRMLFWLFVPCLVALVSLLPNENRDAYATQRTIIGILVILLIAGVHWGFYRKLRLSEASL